MEKRGNIKRSPHFLLLQQQNQHGMCITFKNALQPHFLFMLTLPEAFNLLMRNAHDPIFLLLFTIPFAESPSF